MVGRRHSVTITSTTIPATLMSTLLLSRKPKRFILQLLLNDSNSNDPAFLEKPDELFIYKRDESLNHYSRRAEYENCF